MEEIVLVSGARTAIGRMGGSLQNTPAAELAAVAFKAAIERAGVRPDQIDQVILGCAGQVMYKSRSIKRSYVQATSCFSNIRARSDRRFRVSFSFSV